MEAFSRRPACVWMCRAPQGLCLSPDGSTLYVADTGANLIRAVNLASGAFLVST